MELVTRVKPSVHDIGNNSEATVHDIGKKSEAIGSWYW